jgi:hypothetical protein
MCCASGVPANKGSLRLIAPEDGCIVLDIERDRILKLNAVGAEIWKLLSAGDTEQQISSKIANKYSVDQQRAADDVRALLHKIADLGLAPGASVFSNDTPSTPQDGNQPSFPWYGQDGVSPKPPAKLILVLSALIGLAAFDVILALLSLKHLCFVVRKWPGTGSQQDESTVIGQICTAVDTACVLYPKQALCLQRSSVTACLLKIRGIPARLVIGVRPMPFLAHAWVEVNGSIINDWAGVKKLYQPLAVF